MYYKKIGHALKDFYEVVLFGTMNAKLELHQLLQEDSRFIKNKIESKNFDKMTSKQQQDFIRAYFSKTHL